MSLSAYLLTTKTGEDKISEVTAWERRRVLFIVVSLIRVLVPLLYSKRNMCPTRGIGDGDPTSTLSSSRTSAAHR